LQRQGVAYSENENERGVPSIVHDVLRTPGQPLDPVTQGFMESSFGQDFSEVRVHTDGRAAESAQAVEALAYTAGQDVVFGAGQYAPHTSGGKMLLAHELTHVAQQRGGGVPAELGIGQEDTPYEREADSVASAIVNSQDGKLPQHSSLRGATKIQPKTEDTEGAGLDLASENDEVEDGDSPTGGTEIIGDVSDAQKEDEIGAESDEQAGLMRKPDKDKKKKPADPAKPPRTITRIDVDLSAQNLTITWSDGKKSNPKKISSGKGLPDTKDDPCKDPSADGSNCTPTGTFKPGKKGGADYKNKKGDAMSWYVELEGPGADNRGIGIHDRQPVTGKPASHGCIRIDDPTAKLINKNVTNKTEVVIKGKAPTKPKPKKKKQSKEKAPVQRARLPHPAITTRSLPSPQIQRASLEMWQERPDPDAEAQRLEAFAIIRDHRSHIMAEAAKYNVLPEAIAGAIFWEALENPYSSMRPKSTRLGPGKVHPYEKIGKSEAEKVEEEKRVSVAKDSEERVSRLRDPKWAITYIAAIMRRHADNYMKIAGVDISKNVGVLCTLYQGGKSEERAAKLAERRKTDPTAQPMPGDEMGPWVEKNIETIRGWVNPPPRPH
jgi:lipoprotein-anchoring transpeptidase ErfK/SrfK